MIDITDNNTKLWYLAPTSQDLRNATWKHQYFTKDGKLTAKIPNFRVQKAQRFTGEINTSSLDDSLIIFPNIVLTKIRRLNKESRTLLEQSKYSHHVIQETWWT